MALNVGIVGLGEVAQIIHLPNLVEEESRFRVRAVCDVSPGVLQAVGDRYRIDGRFSHYEEMLEAENLDLVFVLNANEYHAETARSAMEHGAHVFVEKPMCMNRREAEMLAERAQTLGRVLMVGYMRRYDAAFAAARAIMRDWERIDYAEIFDIIGTNRLIIDQVQAVFRFDDVPAEHVAERWRRNRTAVEDALGPVTPALAQAYGMMLGLACHDVSAMRELLGYPERVLAARCWAEGVFFHAMLDFGAYVAALQIGSDRQLRFDAHILVSGPTETLRLQYDTPYIRHLPTLLYRDYAQGEVWTRETVRRTYRDAFSAELDTLYRAITGGTPPKSGPEDFIEDLRLFEDLIRAMKAT